MTNSEILITAADSRYFLSILSLIQSLDDTGNSNYDLVIFDLGLKKWERELLEKIIPSNYFCVDLPTDPSLFPGWDEAGRKDSYAWKARIISEVIGEDTCFLWIDSGVLISAKLSPIFKKIRQKGYFVVRNYDHQNRDWTSEECSTIMKVTTSELNSPQVMANFFGISIDSNDGMRLFESWARWCREELAVKGSRINHRHDQTLLSILAARMELSLVDPETCTVIGRSKRDYTDATFYQITFVSHRNWIYLPLSRLGSLSKHQRASFQLRSALRHGRRWKLYFVRRARWSLLGNSVALIRKRIIFRRSRIKTL